MIRVLYPVPEDPPAVIRIEGDPFHHLAHVLRLGKGDEVEIFDGRGRSFRGRINAIDRASAQVTLGPELSPARLRQITLLQGLPKSDKLEWVLQKGTELGASSFAPVQTERSVVRLSGARADARVKRWSQICAEAARQCGRSDVPRVFPVAPLLDAAAALPPDTRLLVLDEEQRTVTLAQAFAASIGTPQPLGLVVGPEGGLERREVEGLQRLGATAVSLGKRKLRTETAAIAALAILLHLDGQLG